MKSLIVLVSLFLAGPSWAVVYLVSPKTVTVKNETGVSCLAQKKGQAADLTSAHLSFPVTLANPERASFVPSFFRIIVFTKGGPHVCEIDKDQMNASGLGLPVPYGYQMTTTCDLSCGGIDIPANRKLFATVEVFGDFVFADGTKKTAFQENSFEVLNLGTPPTAKP